METPVDDLPKRMSRPPAGSRLHIPEFNEKDPPPRPVPGNLQELDEPRETGTAGQLGGDVGE